MKSSTERELETCSFLIEMQFYNSIAIFYPVLGWRNDTNTGGWLFRWTFLQFVRKVK